MNDVMGGLMERARQRRFESDQDSEEVADEQGGLPALLQARLNNTRAAAMAPFGGSGWDAVFQGLTEAGAGKRSLRTRFPRS